MNLDDFWLFKSQLEFGKKVYLNLGDGIYNPYVIAFHMTYEDASSCTISFSDSYTSFDRSFSLAKLLEQSVSMGKALSYKSGQYSAFVNSGASSQVKEFIDSALDIAKNAVLSTDSQDITIDDTGIRLRKYKKDGSGNYVVDPTGARTHEPEEIWMTDSSILFTDDNWATAKMAIGKIYRQGLVSYKQTTDETQNNSKTYYVNQYGTVWDPDVYGAWSTDLYEVDDQGTDGFGYGIIADYLIGKMIVGQNMIIECPDPNGNTMLFKVDGSGATINNGSMTVTSGSGKVVISPDGGIGVGTASMSYDTSTGWNNSTKFYVDTDGNVHMAGDLSGSTGTFTDGNTKVMIGAGGIGIGGTGLSYTPPSGGTGGWSNANFYTDALGNVHFAGELSGATGTFSGTLSSAGGTFTGVVKASDFQTPDGSSLLTDKTYDDGVLTSYKISNDYLDLGNIQLDGTGGGTVTIGKAPRAGTQDPDTGTGTLNMYGNINMLGTISWSASNSPVRAMYSADNYDYNLSPSSWHSTFNSATDLYVIYSYDGGQTWTSPVKTVGQDGQDGSDAGVTFETINAALGDLYKTWNGGTATQVSGSYIYSPNIKGGNIYGCNIYAGDGQGYISMTQYGLDIYDSDGLLKAELGTYQAVPNGTRYPYLVLGAGSGSNAHSLGRIHKLDNGLWIGSGDITDAIDDGTAPGSVGSTGIFIDFTSGANNIYKYINGVRTEIGSGSGGGTAVAVFG